MSEFLQGFSYPFSGFRLIIRPGIRLYVVIPLLINTLLFSAIIIYGAVEINDLVTWLEQKWSWLAWIGWLLWPLFSLLVLTVFFFGFAVLANLIAAPFNGMLSESVENYLANAENPAAISQVNIREIMLGMLIEVKKFTFILLRTLPVLLLFIIPVIQLAAPLIWLVFVAWMMAMEYLEYPLGNHGMDFRGVRHLIQKNRKLSLGFGLAVSLLTAIPVLNFIAMPVSVAGATRMYLVKLKNT